MKTMVTVRDRAEAHAIQTGLADPTVRAFVVVTGVLLELPTDRARARLLTYIADLVSDPSYPANGKCPEPAAVDETALRNRE
jgi:hypothetical protein